MERYCAYHHCGHKRACPKERAKCKLHAVLGVVDGRVHGKDVRCTVTKGEEGDASDVVAETQRIRDDAECWAEAGVVRTGKQGRTVEKEGGGEMDGWMGWSGDTMLIGHGVRSGEGHIRERASA